MPRAHPRALYAFATGIVLMTLATGCERPSEGKAGPAAPLVRSVEIVHAERHTIRRPLASRASSRRSRPRRSTPTSPATSRIGPSTSAPRSRRASFSRSFPSPSSTLN